LVNAALNWASIVGIVLAVGGAVLYFVRNFKPALARDYDVFFAAVGLLCGGILFFQGWRLDPILQFGQFLLAGSTVFFAYESVRLRGVTTEQARRSAYFEDEEPPPLRPRGGLGGAPEWERERLDQGEPIRRRIRSREEEEEDFYRPRRSSRAAIPERAASRRADPDAWGPSRPDLAVDDEPRMTTGRSSGWRDPAEPPGPAAAARYSAAGARAGSPPFGARRQERDSAAEVRRGSRPVPSRDPIGRSSRRASDSSAAEAARAAYGPGSESATAGAGVPQGTPLRRDARPDAAAVRDADFSPVDRGQPGSRRSDNSPAPAASARTGTAPAGRDNSSRFDD